ncbi:MAG: Fic family protein [Candidatus Eisenbacteria bacterium]|nr:Fic family protein [Candidatus Eisenbacteria bacterium]
MRRAGTGNFENTTVGGETVRAFLPEPLPPQPPLQIEGRLRDSLDRALIALGRLDGVSSLLPDTHLFLYTYVRKEAVLSSQIEGTQSTLSDLLLFELEEAPGVPVDDVVEVSNYVAALEHGLRRLRGGFPLSNRLIREIHEILLSRGRGHARAPGEFRRSQNWIGGTRPGDARYVPPPPHRVEEAMGRLERFLHDQPVGTPALLKAAMAHVQFETIHPFLDGNGRVGRLLITLLLCTEGVLREPMLYLSLYLKQHRSRYYELLDGVRRDGEWEEWIAFFADGVAETAQGAVATAHRLLEVADGDRDRIQRLGRRAGSAPLVHHTLQRNPICTISRLAQKSKLTLPTVSKALQVLVELGIVREVTGKKRHRIYRYDAYMKILDEGTEPL